MPSRHERSAVGALAPLHCTALGKVLLAFGDMDFPTSLDAFTPHTITNPEALRRHLDEIMKQGYAVDNEEFDIGVRCIAVPVFDFRGKAVGSIGISGPASRITRDRLPELTKAVLEIGKALTERMNFVR